MKKIDFNEDKVYAVCGILAVLTSVAYFVIGFFAPMSTMPVLGWHWVVRLIIAAIAVPVLGYVYSLVPVGVCIYTDGIVDVFNSLKETISFDTVSYAVFTLSPLVLTPVSIVLAYTLPIMDTEYIRDMRLLMALLGVLVGLLALILVYGICHIVYSAIDEIVYRFKEGFKKKSTPSPDRYDHY